MKRFIRSKSVRVIFTVLVCLAVAGAVTVLTVNAYVKSVGGARIITAAEASKLEDADCIVVLGCHVREDGSLSHILRDRLVRGLELYEAGAAPKLLMSGDHGRKEYDEVNAMKAYAVENGVPSEDVFMDHAGFSTYETVYRAGEIFDADKIIIVTQEYHLYRALYIADRLGIEAYGVSADFNTYVGQLEREVREIAARCKDALQCVFKPEPTYLGEVIPVSGNGNSTNDS